MAARGSSCKLIKPKLTASGEGQLDYEQAEDRRDAEHVIAPNRFGKLALAGYGVGAAAEPHRPRNGATGGEQDRSARENERRPADPLWPFAAGDLSDDRRDQYPSPPDRSSGDVESPRGGRSSRPMPWPWLGRDQRQELFGLCEMLVRRAVPVVRQWHPLAGSAPARAGTTLQRISVRVESVLRQRAQELLDQR